MAKLKIDADTKNISELEKSFNRFYEHDATLNSLAKFEENRKKLMGLDVGSTPWQKERKEIEELLSSHTLDSAFTSNENYKEYSKTILDSISAGNREAISKSLYPHLNSDYGQTLKATELFSESIEKAKNIGLAGNPYYIDMLNESISQYDNDKLEASNKLLGLTSEINTDLFQTSIGNEKAIEAIANNYTDAKSSIDSLAWMYDTTLASFNKDSYINPIEFSSLNTPLTIGKISNVDTIAGIQNTKDSLLKERLDNLSSISLVSNEKLLKDFTDEPKMDIPDFSHLAPPELPKIEDSSMYKQNEEQIKVIKEVSECIILLNEKQQAHANELTEQNDKLLNSSFQQIELMKSVSEFLASQSKLLEAQRKNQEAQNEHLKEQNEIMKEQIEDNKESAKRALLIAWAGIIIAIFSAFGGAYVEYSISEDDDKLNIKNHTELKKVINQNNNEDLTEKLIEQITIQNNYLKSIDNKLKEQSVYKKDLEEIKLNLKIEK